MANGDTSRVVLPDRPLDIKPHEWELRTKFLAMLAKACSISDWSARSQEPGAVCVPRMFDIDGIDIVYEFPNPYYDIADGRFRMEVPEDELTFYGTLTLARAMMRLGMPKRVGGV